MDNASLGQRPFHPRTMHREPDVVAAFGRPDPPSCELLLHTWTAPAGKAWGNPILLVHGANRNAAYFLDPHEDGSFRNGLPDALRRSGRQVYAVSFAHNQDDNWWWCEALNEAILEVSARHGGAKVDLLGHSKGGVAVRLAATSWRPVEGCTRFLGHLIERILLVGTPNGGVDFFFRYPGVNLAFGGAGDAAVLNWPTSWHHMRVQGRWIKLPMAYSGVFYPGQAQLLGRWREEYPMPGIDPAEETTYEGGESMFGRGHGLDTVMAEGGNMVEELRGRATSPEVSVALLAGASPTMQGALNDTTGPSDGIVYVKSALEFPPEARVVAMSTVAVHHKALIAEPVAQAAIVDMLAASTPLSAVERSELLRDGLALGERCLDALRGGSES